MTQKDKSCFLTIKKELKTGLVILIIASVFLVALSSCISSSNFSLSNFSLEKSSQEAPLSAILTGSVSYGAGFYFPSSSDILDISLLKTNSITGSLSEISHQRIRNIQRFPLQFAIRYDASELGENDLCTLYVTLTSNDKSLAQGFVQLEPGSGSLSGISVVLSSVSNASGGSATSGLSEIPGVSTVVAE